MPLCLSLLFASIPYHLIIALKNDMLISPIATGCDKKGYCLISFKAAVAVLNYQRELEREFPRKDLWLK